MEGTSFKHDKLKTFDCDCDCDDCADDATVDDDKVVVVDDDDVSRLRASLLDLINWMNESSSSIVVAIVRCC